MSEETIIYTCHGDRVKEFVSSGSELSPWQVLIMDTIEIVYQNSEEELYNEKVYYLEWI